MDIHCQIASEAQALAKTDAGASASLLKGAAARLPVTTAEFDALTASLCPALGRVRQLDLDNAAAARARWPAPPPVSELEAFMSKHDAARQAVIDSAFVAASESLTPESLDAVRKYIFVKMAQRVLVTQKVMQPPSQKTEDSRR